MAAAGASTTDSPYEPGAGVRIAPPRVPASRDPPGNLNGMCPGSRPCAFPSGAALAAAAVVLLLSTTAAAGACVRGGPDLANLNDDQLRAAEAGSLLELNNDTLAAHLEAASSAQRYIIFTTTSAWQPELLNMTRNWFAHLQRCVRRRGLSSRLNRPRSSLPSHIGVCSEQGHGFIIPGAILRDMLPLTCGAVICHS